MTAHNRRRVLAAGTGAVTLTAFGLVLAPAATADGVAERIAGDNRYETAVEISQKGFAEAGSASAVVLARSDDYADALAGAPLAAHVGGPLLLTPSGVLQNDTKAEIERVLAEDGTVYVLGGEAAIGADVVAELEELDYTVERIAGENRYGTSVAVAEEVGDEDGPVLLSTGWNYPDALAAGAAAAHQDGVVLLTSGSVVPDEVETHLGGLPDADIYAVGGPGARAAAASEIEATTIIGGDRYDTAVRVAAEFFHDGEDAPDGAVLATGWEFADALAGGAWSGSQGRPVLLTATNVLPDVTADYIAARSTGEETFTVSVLGGQNAVSGNILEALQGAFGDPLVASYHEESGVLSGSTSLSVGSVTVTIGDETRTVPVAADGGFSLDVSELTPGDYTAVVTAGTGASAVTETVEFTIADPDPTEGEDDTTDPGTGEGDPTDPGTGEGAATS